MARQSRLAIRCGVLVDGDGGEPLTNVTVTVQGGRIVGIADCARGDAVDVDYSDCTMIPGLIDAHAHPCFGVAGDESWTRVADDPMGRLAWGMLSAQATLATGVTTLVDVGSADGVAIDLAAAERRGYFTGPRVLASGRALTVTGGHGVEIGRIADSMSEIVKGVRGEVESGADLIKVMATGGAIDPQSNRRRAQYSTAELRSLVTDAHRLNRRVVAHANATEGIRRAVEAGVDVIAHCNWLGIEPDTVTVDWDLVDQMVEQETCVDLNIHGAIRDLAQTDGQVTDWPAGRPDPKTRWELLAPLRDRGVPIYLTSDGFGPAVAQFSTLLRQFARDCAVPIEEVVSLVTSVPAAALGLADLGHLREGAIADFAILPGDLTRSRAFDRPRAVYRGGVQVARPGWLQVPPMASKATDTATAQAAFLSRVLGEPGR